MVVARFFLGCVADKVARGATRAVLTVRPSVPRLEARAGSEAGPRAPVTAS